jgi:hypothetical protein
LFLPLEEFLRVHKNLSEFRFWIQNITVRKEASKTGSYKYYRVAVVIGSKLKDYLWILLGYRGRET